MNQKDELELKMITDTILNTVDVNEIILFGSFAYGTPDSDSDFDIYVILPDDGERPLTAVQKINLAIGRMDIRAVDLLSGTEKAFMESCHGTTLESMIRKKGKILYKKEREKSENEKIIEAGSVI